MNTTTKAQGFLKDLGIFQNLSEEPHFSYKGVDFSYFENKDGTGSLIFEGHEVFGTPYTNSVQFDGGAPIKTFTSMGEHSNKSHFKADLKTCIDNIK